jgi:hypothetical protein
MTVDAHHEDLRSMAFESATKFSPGSKMVFGSLLSVTDKMGDLSLQEPKPWAITRSGADQFQLTPIQVGLAWDARPGHKFGNLGESKSDLSRDSANHREIYCLATIDPTDNPVLKSDSNGGCDRTTSEMRGLSPKIISVDSRRSENT